MAPTLTTRRLRVRGNPVVLFFMLLAWAVYALIAGAVTVLFYTVALCWYAARYPAFWLVAASVLVILALRGLA